MTKIGILALQGAFAEHEQVLKALGVETVQIRNRQDWEAHADLDGLILPGGESTVMGKLLHDLDLFDLIKAKIEKDLPVFGTCAGLILLAKTIVGDQTKHLASMDISVARNAYGRQLGSFVTNADFKGIGEIPMVLFVDQSLKPLDQKLKFYLRSREPSWQPRKKICLSPHFIQN